MRKTVMIGSGSVSTPVSRFTVVRNGDDACAIRFTSFHRNDLSIFYADYDWYYQNDGSGNFTKSNVKTGRGSLRDFRSRLLIMFASKLVTCGSFRLFWDYPTHLGFTPSSTREPDLGNELAPTKWTAISDVNIRDPRLKWFRRVDQGRRIDIPIDKLW